MRQYENIRVWSQEKRIGLYHINLFIISPYLPTQPSSSSQWLVLHFLFFIIFIMEILGCPESGAEKTREEFSAAVQVVCESRAVVLVVAVECFFPFSVKKSSGGMR